EGLLTIARRFNAGDPFRIAQVPKGRLNKATSYVSSYFHCVFSTKERRPMITPEFSRPCGIGTPSNRSRLLSAVPPGHSFSTVLRLGIYFGNSYKPCDPLS